MSAQPEVPEDTFELRLQIARWHAGHLNPVQAGERVGVTGQTWRNWERGIYSDAARRPSMLAFIAKQLRVNPEWLEHGGALTPAPPSDQQRPKKIQRRTPDYSVAALRSFPSQRDGSPLLDAA